MLRHMPYRIFISHASKDQEVARQIAAALDSAGQAPWLGLREIRPGDSFVERMNEGLAKASYVLVLLSEAANASRWVTREWMAALAAPTAPPDPVIGRATHADDLDLDPPTPLMPSTVS